MKSFVLTPEMLATIGGAFYPKGHSVLMFESAELAKEAGRRLEARQLPGLEAIQFIAPQAVLDQIAPTVAEADNPLPSPGTDAATVRAYTELARKGHAGLLVPTPDEADRDAMMEALGDIQPSMAQRYRMLVIEDL